MEPLDEHGATAVDFIEVIALGLTPLNTYGVAPVHATNAPEVTPNPMIGYSVVSTYCGGQA